MVVVLSRSEAFFGVLMRGDFGVRGILSSACLASIALIHSKARVCGGVISDLWSKANLLATMLHMRSCHLCLALISLALLDIVKARSRGKFSPYLAPEYVAL
jgi:nitrate/nitrite transporter NarK